ncbi:lipoxygenase homology domain-containing protein 1-like, partial [Saccoglossus kowalevskii]
MEDRQTKRQIKLLGVRPVQKTEAEEDKHKSKGNWKVLVKTCDGENAGTESNVFISVYGKDNKKELIPLNNGEIRPAEEKDFEINVGEIGEIYKIRLEHDNTSEEPAWHVNKVIMEDKDSKEKLTFICNSWLSRDKENCDIYKELPALRSGQDPRPLKSYIIEVHTSDDDDDASTGANVFLTLFGSHGDTGKRQLIKVKPERKSDSDENQEEKKLFQKGQVDSFLIEAVSLGELEKIVVFIDSGEPDNAWLLDKIIVKESEFSKVQWQFACQDWIGKIQVDGMVMSDREIWGVERPVSAPETENETPPDDGESNSQGKWHVWMRTGKDDKMGTTAKTYMMVYGQNGCTDPIPLLKEGESVKEQDEEENKLDEKKQENIKEDKKDVVLRFESGSTEEFD